MKKNRHIRFRKIVCLWKCLALLGSCVIFSGQVAWEAGVSAQDGVSNSLDVQPVGGDAETQARRLSEFESAELAWEYDPYQVKVWICYDKSSFLNANMETMSKQLHAELELMDASGWRLMIEQAPHPWNWRLMLADDLNQYSESLVELPAIFGYDKLICVRLRHELGRFHYDAQEFDFRTQQWGARNIQVVGNRDALVQSLTSSISNAFMPLARIDKVVDKIVKLRARASGLHQKLEQAEDGTWVLADNRVSPVSIKENDVFLPVIRRLDRDDRLEGINRIEWTYLSIIDAEGPLIECTTHATARAPLSGRSGRRTQRFALVIRAPNRPTILKLTSNDKNAPRPLPDLEIYSRPPGADTEEASELLGTTDWRGMITIPPNQDSLRILYVKSGARPLARLPMIPGLFDQMVSPMPDDERRLYAEGIVTGLQYELIDLVVQRKVLSYQIEQRLQQRDYAGAQELISELRGIANAIEFNNKLGNEQKRLQSSDPREAEKIRTMFSELQSISDEQLTTTLETLWGRKLAVAREGGDWESVTLDGIVRDTELINIEQELEEGELQEVFERSGKGSGAQ